MLLRLASVALGGCIGCMLRYSITLFCARHLTTYVNLVGTLCANVIGCFLIGGAVALLEAHLANSINLRLFIVTGLLGGLTTFSALSFDTFELLREQEFFLALANSIGQMLLGIIFVGLGFYAARSLT